MATIAHIFYLVQFFLFLAITGSSWLFFSIYLAVPSSFSYQAAVFRLSAWLHIWAETRGAGSGGSGGSWRQKRDKGRKAAERQSDSLLIVGEFFIILFLFLPNLNFSSFSGPPSLAYLLSFLVCIGSLHKGNSSSHSSNPFSRVCIQSLSIFSCMQPLSLFSRNLLLFFIFVLSFKSRCVFDI